MIDQNAVSLIANINIVLFGGGDTAIFDFNHNKENAKHFHLLPASSQQAAWWKRRVHWPLHFDHGKLSYVKLPM